jgi:hypothetical protein
VNYPGFIGPSGPSQSPLANCERTVNWYVEPNDAASGRPALYPTPGQSAFVTVSDSGTRALFTMNGRTFAVVGSSFGEVFSGGTFTKYGTVAYNSALAQITANGISGNQLGVSSGTNFYAFNLSTNTLSAAVLVGESTQIGMLDGYGVIFNQTAGKIRLSALNDFSTADPTMFALRSSAPDNWQAMLVKAPDVVLVGEQTGEVWYDAGTSSFPLAPRPGVKFEYGIAATWSIAAAGDSILWLSRNADGAGVVVRMRGYVPQPINSYALDTAIAEYQRTATIADAEALVYQRAGHTFYVLKFPSANATWVYDLRTGLWHERGTWNRAAGRFDVWGPRAITYAFGKHLVGDASGVLAYLDDTVGTEVDGTAIRRVRIPPALAPADGDRLFVDRFELGIDPGLGTATGQGSDPEVMLRISHDFGKTWGTERRAKAGKQGEYDTRVVWTRCGSSPRAWVPEISISDPIVARLTGAAVDGRGIARDRRAA